MTSAIPSSFSFEMLSRLPPQSFELQYREIRPDLEPNGGVYPTSQDSRVAFHIRGAPNEFILNTHCELSGAVKSRLAVPVRLTHATALSATGLADWNAVHASGVNNVIDNITPLTGNAFDDAITGGAAAQRQLVATARNNYVAEQIAVQVGRVDYRYGPTWINSSRESFNSGALPFLDNQDRTLHLANNALRGKCAKRWTDQAAIQDLKQSNFDGIGAAGFRGVAVDVPYVIYDLASAANPLPVPAIDREFDSDVGARPFSMPLGFYSNLVNGHSVVPVGLMSSYSVNGWTVETTLANLNATGNQSAYSTRSLFGQEMLSVDNAQLHVYRNMRINIPVVKVLDPAVMDAVFSLYEKREMVNVGGAAFPMSLRLNSLGYRTFQFPLRGNQGDYYFRLPSTDRSVRAVSYQIVDRISNQRARTDNTSGPSAVRVSRLSLKVGSKVVFDPVEDREPDDSNVQHFLAHGSRRSSALFSPFPYYQESMKHSEDQCDSRASSWCSADDNLSNDQYGVISLENLDHREPEYSGSFQASGFDLTGVGGLDLDMRISRRGATPTSPLESGPANDNYVITFLVAYDVIHEVSPSGVIDITNAVL